MRNKDNNWNGLICQCKHDKGMIKIYSLVFSANCTYTYNKDIGEPVIFLSRGHDIQGIGKMLICAYFLSLQAEHVFIF